MSNEQAPRNIGLSILAVIVGLVVAYILTRITDSVLHKVGFFPPMGEWNSSRSLAVAAAYRSVFIIFGSYLVAVIAPRSPTRHALISAAIGVIPTVIGTFLTWNLGLGAHWYPLLLIVTALPCAWAGARLRIMHLRPAASAPVTR